jgi:hypothetical protein
MAITTQDVSATVTGIQAAGDLILQEIQALDPGVAVPAGVAEMLLDLAAKAVAAWAAAAGVPVTVENLQLLEQKLNPDPLSQPTS